MTDAQFAFISDIRERKGMARGSYAKVNGSKSKKCTLPSDFLTEKERKKLNGECGVWDFRHFYTFESFKEMPLRIQVEYINNLIDKWSVSISVISVELFGKNTNYLYEYAKRNGITWHKQAKTSKSLTLAFISAIRASREHSEPSEPEVEIELPEEEKPVESEKTASEEKTGYSMDYVELNMTDGIDYSVLNAIYQQFDGYHCKIKIIIMRKDNE